ncbi:MAG TPA: hypothetical protein VM243_04470 [Phycisphaerae bacterium]|nr:hypothetical protein [Phycisphaerae bacterium]
MSKSGLGAVFFAGFVPRRTAVAHRDMSLVQAYGIHWFALLLGTITFMAVLSQDAETRLELLRFWESGEVFTATGAVVSSIIVVVAEGIFLLFSLLLLPWGDGTAGVGTAWRHAVRTVWLHTGHLALNVCLFAAACLLSFGYLEPLRQYWWPEGSTPRTDSAVLQWVANHYEYVLLLSFLACGAWYLASLLRGMTVPLAPSGPTRPPLCEACGYNLSHHEPSARCPECGRPVAMSVGPHVRTPVQWLPLPHRPRRTGFLSAAIQPWTSPQRFFMTVPANGGLGWAGSFLLVQLILTAAALPVGWALSTAVFDPEEFARIVQDEWFGETVLALTCSSLALGCFCALVAGLSAAIIGLVFSRYDRRNQTGAAQRVACFCAGIFPAGCYAITAGAVAGEILLTGHSHRYEYYLEVGTLGLIAAVIVFYIGAVARRMRYVRYANS